MGRGVLSFKLRLYSAFVLIFAFLCVSYGAQQSAPTAVTRSTIFPDLYEASISELQDGLEKGQFTSVDLVKVSI